jgi:endonuclease YncB( thermonuclease family)
MVITTVIAVAAVAAVLGLLRRGEPVPDRPFVLVTRVIDGDTFDAIRSDDPQRRLRIRIVGIDARNGLATVGPRTAWPTKLPRGLPR